MICYRIENLIKKYNGQVVLDIPDLELVEKGFYALLGPNGSGKTTFLNILAFLDKPDKGYVHYCGRQINGKYSELIALRKEIVIVDQHPVLFSTSVYKNVEFGLKMHGIPKKQRRIMVEEALEIVGMERFKDAPGHKLSGGETQRVAVARALVLSPAVLLCDEPASSVDIEHQGLISRILKELWEEKKMTLIFTTHDRYHGMNPANGSLVLTEGKLVPAYYENLFTAVFEKEYEESVEYTIDGLLQVKIPKDRLKSIQEKVRLYIDPEKITLTPPTGIQSHEGKKQGHLSMVMEQGGKIKMLIHGGVKITVYMSWSEYKSLRPAVGEPVSFSFPSEALFII